MQLSLCAVGRKMPAWVQQGADEYQKRLPRQWQFKVRETAQANSDELVAQSDQQWSLSPLTFPHPLVRIIVVEQLYRAHSMLINHPYHRA